MKKLNRKGFTLVELLAVIVILAIVVGISIPSVTNIINGSKNSALGVAVDAAVDHLQDEYDMYILDKASVGGESSLIGRLIKQGEDATNKYLTLSNSEDLEALGFDPENVKSVKVKVKHNDSTQKADICVNVRQINGTDSDYYTTAHWKTDGSVKPEPGDATGKDISGVKNKAGNTSTACNE